MITWQLLPFDQLSTHQLYQLLKLRVDVFVVEQTCPYPELDGKDSLENVHHLMGYKDDELVACARLLPQNVSYPSVSIGRVATAQAHRGDGLGHQLLEQALLECDKLWPGQDIEIGAQEHLETYYNRHGFQRTSEMYLEDDIPHIDMKFSR
ncbi:GNAT family N-acetyltransferase [Vibrio coralliilyticus]|uniref:GNAT family N-acetyltransferase n=1 Tax=Vibrio coralliilyticus TaxID=190893 RepID=UPI000BAB2340|nr:GNAT family N-acetyltransferase [Vibrio coralliilyticus]NOI58308.1 GNAT family N-acetyltransferase [Vibrio coralliilyticus]PAT67548.1 GNAT family N-acetyltransferase [Vibrio coralliilyticus]WFB47877.1 GNAT family N-acetyltransferase [Vibrio coralliilyticus]